MNKWVQYQWITTTAKKVGGIPNLIIIFLSTGYLGGRLAEAVLKKIINSTILKHSKTEKMFDNVKKYVVTTDGESNEGVAFKTDEEVIVLEHDGDVVLVHKIGDPDSPYYVSEEFLSSISEYKAE